jgi:uncharacterized membrane protein YesL
MRLHEPLDAVQVVRRSLYDAWDALLLIGTLNLAWAGFSLTIVLFPAATAALFESMHELAHGRSQGIHGYVGAVRRRFVASWLWAFWCIGGLTIVFVNFRFYDTSTGSLSWLAAAVVVLGALFAVSVLYVWPFVFRQSSGGILRALRNSALAVLAAPLFALTLAVLLMLIVGVSAVLILPLAVFTPAFICLVAAHAVTDRLRAFGKLSIDPATDEAA